MTTTYLTEEELIDQRLAEKQLELEEQQKMEDDLLDKQLSANSIISVIDELEPEDFDLNDLSLDCYSFNEDF